MTKIEIHVIGKPHSRYIIEGINQYRKWLSSSFETRIKYYPLKNYRNLPPENIKEKEADLYLKNINESEEVFVLHEKGKEFTSIEFNRKINDIFNNGKSKITFLIGGPYGLSSRILEKNWLKLSLSKMTFTHEMSVLLLLEQLYRSYTIDIGKKYHF
jgi:23S rRNA (pseudouridine1915-N3)-methyltransferase